MDTLTPERAAELAELLSDPAALAERLPAAEREAYERATRSIIEARRRAPLVEGLIVLGTAGG